MNRMSQHAYTSCVAIVLALVLASALACSQSPSSPNSPTGTGPSGTGAAADGSTLKVPAPPQVSPVGNVRINSRKPTLIFTNVNGKYAGSTFQYEIDMYDGANQRVLNTTVNQGAGTTTQYEHPNNLEKNSPYTWRVRARMGSYLGPWSPSAGFITVDENRTPDPAPGQKLPLPNGKPIVDAVSAVFPPTTGNTCSNTEAGWQWMDRVVAALRETDTRWGYNWKRANVGDPSLDVINYHWGPGPDEGSLDVHTVKILRCQEPAQPTTQWTDISGSGGAGARWTCFRCKVQ